MNTQSDAQARRMADSMGWNLARRWNMADLNKGDEPKLDISHKREDSWWLISRHASGTASAYVVQRRLRIKYPNVETKVVNTRDTEAAWDAEIWARTKTTQEGNADDATTEA